MAKKPAKEQAKPKDLRVTLHGEFDVGRPTGGSILERDDHKDVILIGLRTPVGPHKRALVVEAELDPADFSLALTGRGQIPCHLLLNQTKLEELLRDLQAQQQPPGRKYAVHFQSSQHGAKHKTEEQEVVIAMFINSMLDSMQRLMGCLTVTSPLWLDLNAFRQRLANALQSQGFIVEFPELSTHAMTVRHPSSLSI